ncbi:glycoside hydrolase family 9 protein [Anaerocolumna jejuensis]|uniref:glycoside hydrolase family 9 protein n=1 Tax=Anaerocolumna jejuensis TaxID=259063 RepID=UPI003F7C5F9B
MKRQSRIISFLAAVIMIAAFIMPAAVVQANASGVFIRVNQVGYKPSASKVAMVLSSTNLNGVRYDVFNSSNTSVLNGTVSSANKGSWGDAGGANCAYTYALDFSALSTIGSGYYIRINNYTSPVFPVSDSVYSSLADLSMQFFKVQRCGNTNPKDHGVCHITGTSSSVDGKPDGASGTIDVTGGWHDASDYIKFMSTIGHVADVMLTTYIHHPEVFPSPESTGGVLTEAKVGLDFIRKMWDNTNQILYMEVADGLDHDVENDDLDSRSKCWPENDNTIYGASRPVHPCPAGKGANLAGKAAAALALGAKIWGDPSGPSYNAALASNYLTAAQQIYTWGKTRTGIAGDADEFYVDTDYKDDMAWAAAELYRATGTASYLADAKSYCDSAGEWYNKSDTSLNWSRAYAWANYEVASLDPAYKSTVISRMNNHLNVMKTYADAQFWNNSSQPKWGTYEAMSNNAVEAMMYQELSGNSTYSNLAQQQLDFMLGKNPWGVSMLNGAGTTWFQNPRHRVTTLNRVSNPGYQLLGAWSEGFETSAQYAVDQSDPLLSGQENPNIVQFNDSRMVWHDNRRDYATNEVTISGNVAGMAMAAFMGGSYTLSVPTVPTGLAAAAGASQINVTWSAAAGAAGYDLEADGTIISNAVSPYVHTGLAPGQTHSYRVRAKNSAGTSAWSTAVSAVTSASAVDYPANADAYVRDGTYATTNYGTAATIDVKGDPDAGYNRKSFLKFDLTGRTGTSVASATLKVYCNGASAATPLVIYGLSGTDTWVESGSGSITWNNQPSSTNAVTIGTLNVTAAGWYAIDVTSYVNSQMSEDKKVTFKMQVENNNGATLSFNSRENASNKPVLVVN